MGFTVKIILDKRRKKKDDTFPLIIIMTVNRRNTTINLGISLEEKDWDEKNFKIKRSYKGVNNVSRLNNMIQKERSKLMDFLFRMEDEGKIDQMSTAELKAKYQNKQGKVTFFSFTEQLVKEFADKGKVGNSTVYKETISWVKRYGNGKDLKFSQMTFAWLKRMEVKYLGQGKSLNGLSVRMRTIRAIYNRAVKEGIASKDSYPFDKYTIRQAPTKKRAISADDLRKIKETKLLHGQMLRARNFFMISYYLMGASFIDLAFLKVKNIQDGRIAYRRRKTHKLYNIKITEPLADLLAPFLVGKRPDDFILPVINRPGDVKLEYLDVQNGMRQYNKDLKKMAKFLEIQSDSFSSYVSRHTFATVARDKDVPIAVISKMLGHGDVRTTEIYLDDMKNEVLDEAMLRMLE